MAPFHPAWAEHQRKRWMRPDAHLWIRPDAYRFMAPGAPRYLGNDAVRYFWPDSKNNQPAEADDSIDPRDLAAEREALVRLRSELAALKAELKFHRLLREGKAGFRQDQPRWPKESGEISGRWSGGAGTAPAGADPKPSGPAGGGHHFVPREIFDNEPLRPETRRVFEQNVTGPLNAGPHRNSKEHGTYNDAVSEHYSRFLRENGIRPEDMTPDQARRLVEEVKRSSDPRVRGFNMRIYMREILYWLRRVPRGNE